MFIYPSERIISVLDVIFLSSSFNLLSKYLLPFSYAFYIYALTWHLFVIKMKRIVIADKRIIFDIYLVGICLAPAQIRKTLILFIFEDHQLLVEWFLLFTTHLCLNTIIMWFLCRVIKLQRQIFYIKKPCSNHQYSDHKQIYAKYKNDFRWFVSLKYDSSSFSISEAMASKLQNYHWAW